MNPLSYNLTRRFRYYLYLFTFCLASTVSVQAQFSEEDLEKQANELFESGKFGEAMPLYSQLLSLDPTNPTHNYKYGATALYGDSDKKEEAVKYLNFATKKGGVDNKAWFFLGRAYHLNYQFADAVRAYDTFKEKGSSRDIEELELERHLESARNGLNLLSKIKDVKVLDKKLTAYESFFRVYELGEIGGKILVTPDELLSSLDKKNNHKSLIHFRGTGTTVYFSSYGKDGKSGLDIYKAQVLPGGQFSDPVKLSGFVNSEYDEDYPFMHPDGKSFYFSSTGHSSMGGFDIFKSTYDEGMDTFSEPENLDFAVNTPDDELFYIADTAKKVANFASARSSKQGELYVYKVLVQSNPVELTLVKGSFVNRVNSSQKLAKIAVIDAATNEKVSEQYTDPNNGDYVVSVPKSGRYKFVVEVQNSDKVHAGMVDIPKSAGVKAYLQEMELILSAGVEKLLINNKFDETFEGDVLALAKDLLRKQAELDVNFDPKEEPEVDPEPEPEQDFALAYKAAGFPAGMTNDKVLEAANNRVSEFEKALDDNETLKAKSIDAFLKFTSEANVKLTEAEDMIQRAEQVSGDEKAKMMFSAAILKMQSMQLLKKAQSAEELASEIESANEEIKENLNLVSNHAQSLEEAIEAKNFEQALGIMQKENSAQKGEIESFNYVDVEGLLLQSSLDAKERSVNLMNSSADLREEADDLNAKLVTRKRQLENARGKDAKQLEEEVERLKIEIKDLEDTIDSSFDRASKSQEMADSEERQYNLYTNFTEEEVELSAEEEKSLLNTEISSSELDSYSDRLSNLQIDEELVSQYTENNPQAFNDFDPDIRRLVASTYLSEQSQSPEGNLELIAQNETNSSQNEDAENPSATAGAGERSEDKTENKVIQDSKEPGSPDLNDSNDSSVENAATAAASNEELLSTEENDEGLTIENSADQNTNELTDSANSNPSAQIEAEKIKIKAAQDWLTIIDSSIADLEQGVGGEDGEDVQEQLTEYRELRSLKISEIENSQEIIAELSTEIETVKGYSEAAINAQEDLDALSNAQLASLESKIVNASSEVDYVKDISKVDPNYIPELTAAELSGLSTPEIAEKRIEINKELLVSLDELIKNEGATELSDERLRELRSIKLLEIQQDEQILIGAQEYQARTVEAREYSDLISETEEITDTGKADLSALSPKMQEDLSTEFSRTLVMESYASDMAAFENAEEDSSSLSEQIKLNKSYLQNLQNEINFYSQTINTQGENVPAELQKRYGELLADRSKIADEIQDDQELLANIKSKPSTELAVEETNENNPSTLPEASTYSEQLDKSYQRQLEEIKSLELSDGEELKALAKIRFEQAEYADSLVVAYIDELDKSESPAEKDQIQQLIQKLDAISADKRQEADRLMYESDALATATNDKTITETDDAQRKEIPTIKNVETATDIDFRKLTYKSLNANIAYSKLEDRVDSLNLKKQELQQLVNDYNSADEEPLKRELLVEIENKELEVQALEVPIIREISESNAAEIAYYQKANDRILRSIESNYAQEADLAEYSERASEISEMLARNETERNQNKKPENEYLSDQLSLISSLSDLNADMDAYISSQAAEDENVALELSEGEDSPYELLLNNPENYKPEEGSKYLTPVFKQVESSLSNERKEELAKAAPILSTDLGFVGEKSPENEKQIISISTNVDEKGFELLKASPKKLSYVLNAVKADSLRTLEVESAQLVSSRSQAAKEKYTEASRLRNMVVHQNSEKEKELVRKRAENLEGEAEFDLEMASVAAVSAEAIRIERIVKEEQLASSATDLSSSELNELNALLRKETYTIIPNVDLGRQETASNENINSPEEITASPDKTKSSDETGVAKPTAQYSKDELNLFNRTGNWLDVVEIIAEKDDFSDVEESLFIESEESAYSDKNPIPIDPVMPDGLIFQVQVGAFRNPIPQDLYKEFAPVMGQELSNGITRYRAGLFRIYKEAKDTRDLIRQKGYSDAFVVVYVDGERLTGAQARQILAQAREMDEDAPTESSESSNEVTQNNQPPLEAATPEEVQAADYYNDPEAAEATQVEITKGLFYTVQVGVYSKPVKLDQLYDLTELNSELTTSGYIRYTSGRYIDLDAAKTRKNTVVQKGVSDAFITAYYNGKRISLDEARMVLNEQGNSVLFNENSTSQKSQDDSDDVIEYVVIMGMTAGEMPEELANSFANNEDWNIQRMQGPGGQEMFVSPKFTNRAEADQFLQLAKEAGVESAIMGKMVNGSIAEVDIEN